MTVKYDYDLIIVGAGTAGVVSAVYSKALYKRVLLVESDRPGGRNFFSFSYPMSALMSIARKLKRVSSLSDSGILSGKFTADLFPLRKKIRETVEIIADDVSPSVLKEMDIDYLNGKCSFVSANKIMVEGREFSGAKIILSCGLQNTLPEIEGISSENSIFTEDIINLEKIPRSALVIGAGESGIETACILASFGSSVTVIEKKTSLLQDEDAEIMEMIEKNMAKEHITVIKSASVIRVSKMRGYMEVKFTSDGKENSVRTEIIICCTGRKPAYEDLNIDALGVKYDDEKIVTDKYLRTSNRHIFAAGDITGRLNYNNTAEVEGLTAVINSAHFMKKTVRYDMIPRCLFCDMEFARFGMTESEAYARYGSGVRIYKFPIKHSIKASVEDLNDGVAKIVCKSNSKIVGAQIYSEGASELVHQLLILVRLKKKFSEISHISHIFPSYSDILRQPSKRCLMEQQFEGIFAGIIHLITGGRR